MNAIQLFYKIVMLERLDICISLENAIEESYHIINLVKPDWKKDEIVCKVKVSCILKTGYKCVCSSCNFLDLCLSYSFYTYIYIY